MKYETVKDGTYEYVDLGEGPVVIFLHGLMGALSNFEKTARIIAEAGHRVVIPSLPIYTLPLLKTSAKGISRFLENFIKDLKLEDVTLLGNSLGGHVALIYTKNNPELVKRLMLTGSSGLYEKAMGDTFPRREDYNYIKEKTQNVFYDPAVATKELVDEVFESVNSRDKVIRILAIAKSAIRHNMAKDLPKMTQDTCLLWGKNDAVTPPEVADEFHRLLPNSELYWFDKCGHAPMMEHPVDFANTCVQWLKKH
ncbi:MAG: alpha/beta hydrolase [Flavobacteriales bacterium]|nr:alpha/beta hydrolase [Flavobacteriales bacterium]